MDPSAVPRVTDPPAAPSPAHPTVSVVVPTRNRPRDAAACVASILEADGALLEIVVVDQSEDRETETALSAIADPRLRYVRTDTRGATTGRNLGIESSVGEVIAFTDDDCRVARDWVSGIASIFASDPQVAIVCGRVRVPPEIQHLGFAASFEPGSREWSRRFPPPGPNDWGITANFAARREVFAQMGPFDPLLGPGAVLRSAGGEELDLLFRVLKAGLKVVNAREVQVDHLGVRPTGPAARAVIHGYGVGISAAFLKHVRLGEVSALGLYLDWLFWLGRNVVANLIRGERPLGLSLVRGFLSGTLGSFRFAVDRKSRLYVVR